MKLNFRRFNENCSKFPKTDTDANGNVLITPVFTAEGYKQFDFYAGHWLPLLEDELKKKIKILRETQIAARMNEVSPVELSFYEGQIAFIKELLGIEEKHEVK